MTKAVNLVLIILVLAVFCVSSTSAQTTEISYQGNLKESGLAANANYDIEFRLYSALTGGSLIGTEIYLSPVTVTDGVFAVKLDFGPNGFPGQDRYLEIAVRRTGVGSLVTLGPRQKISSAPYAIQSLQAATATMALIAGNAQALGGVNASQYVVTGDPRLTDARNPLPGSANYVQNTTTQQASSNFNVSGTGTAGIFNATTRYNFGGNHLISAAGPDNIFAGNGSGLLNLGENNAFFGSKAGFENKQGSFNAFFGAYAGQNNVTGNNNSFFGYFAGNGTTSGSDNSFFGNRAGQVNSSGAFNSFFGTFSGLFNSTGSDNSFFGNETGFSNVNGNRNSFFGSKAGRGNDTGSDNAFLGSFAGRANTSGSNNSFVGSNAGQGNATGINNSFFGSSAGFTNTANNNSFFGTEAGRFNSTGANNTFLGRGAGHDNTTGELNVFVGVNAGNSNLLGRNNTIVGSEADVLGSNLSYATAIGAEAIVNTSNTVVLGRPADSVRVPGSLNVLGSLSAANLNISAITGVIGAANGGTGLSSPGMAGRFLRSDGVTWQSLPLTVADILAGSPNYVQNGTTQQGSTNFNISGNGTAGGTLTGNAVNSVTQYNIGGTRVLSTAGISNLFAGNAAGNANSTGGSNAFFGASAGTGNTTGSGNSFFGSGAGSGNVGGGNNTFVGATSGNGNGSGANNSYFGANSGQTNTLGSNNTIIGASANVGSNNLTYATAIGSDAVVSTNNTVVLGRSVDTVRAPGNLQVDGTLTANNFSIPASNLTGTVAVANGGTGMSSPGVSGNYLRSNGSIWESSAIAAGDIPAGSPNYIQNGIGVQTSTNFNISGNGTAGGTLSGNAVNSTTQYNIGGLRVLSNTGASNIFVGTGTGISGSANSFFGVGSGATNTTGTSNTLLGNGADVTAGNLTFATAVGAGATVSNNNSVVLGRAADTVRVPGNLTVTGTFTAPTFTIAASNITGVLAMANGGTGVSSSGTAGNVLRSNGTTWTSSPLIASDIPTLTGYVQNGTGLQSGASFNVGGSGAVGGNFTVGGTITGSLATSNLTGLVSVTQGGTGLNSAGSNGHFLRSNGTGFTTAALVAGDIPSLAASYVQNGTALQTGASFNVGGTGAVGGNLTVGGTITGSLATSNLTGLVGVTQGGTGLNSAGTSGHFLRSNGTGFTTAALVAGDIPSLAASYVQNTTTAQAGANFNVGGNGTIGGNLTVGGTISGSFSVPAGNITGTLGAGNGGTGVSGAGVAGNVLRSNGSLWQSAPLIATDIPSLAGLYVQNTATQQAGANFNVGGNGTIGGNLTVGGTISGSFSVPATSITGTLAVNRGGTGLNSAGTNGHFLKSDGTGFVTSALTAAEIPSGSTNYIQNGTTPQALSNFNISGSGVIGDDLTVAGDLTVNGALNGTFTVPAANVTGTLAPANGGTGVTSSGTAGNVLRSNGTTWQAAPLQASDIPSLGGTYIQNSTAQQATSNFNVSGSGTVGTTMTVGTTLSANTVNSVTQYNINGVRVFATNGTSNMFAGEGAGNTGSSNSFLGSNAGNANTTGSENTIVGANADVVGGTLTNATAVGANAAVSQNNSLVLGSISGVNGAGSDTSVGIGTTAPKAKLDVRGGNVYVGSPGQGIVLKSPDGLTCKLLSIDNAGAMVLGNTTCP